MKRQSDMRKTRVDEKKKNRNRDDHDPLCGLNRELKFLAGKNILEELELNVTVQVQEDASCRTRSEERRVGKECA